MGIALAFAGVRRRLLARSGLKPIPMLLILALGLAIACNEGANSNALPTRGIAPCPTAQSSNDDSVIREFGGRVTAECLAAYFDWPHDFPDLEPRYRFDAYAFSPEHPTSLRAFYEPSDIRDPRIIIEAFPSSVSMLPGDELLELPDGQLVDYGSFPGFSGVGGIWRVASTTYFVQIVDGEAATGSRSLVLAVIETMAEHMPLRAQTVTVTQLTGLAAVDETIALLNRNYIDDLLLRVAWIDRPCQAHGGFPDPVACPTSVAPGTLTSTFLASECKSYYRSSEEQVRKDLVRVLDSYAASSPYAVVRIETPQLPGSHYVVALRAATGNVGNLWYLDADGRLLGYRGACGGTTIDRLTPKPEDPSDYLFGPIGADGDLLTH